MSNSNNSFTEYKQRDWNGIALAEKHAPYITQYLNRIEQSVNDALSAYPRMMMVRVDLRYPKWYDHVHDDGMIIKRFIGSLQSQIDADLNRRSNTRVDRRLLRCKVRYLWVREQCMSNNPHYHFALFFNADAYSTSGFKSVGRLAPGNIVSSNLTGMIMRAWASALGMEEQQAVGLAFIPENPAMTINSAKPTEANGALKEVMLHRLSYFAKFATKPLGRGYRCIGSSQG